MKKIIWLSFVVILLAMAGSAWAQQRGGDFELQFYGMYFRTVGQEFTMGSGTIGGKIGPYLTDRIQIGMGPSLTITTTSFDRFDYDPNLQRVVKTEETNTTTTFGTSVFFVYSFLTSGAKLVPYFGAQWFKSDFNKPLTEDRGSAGINAGAKYFFARKTALDLSVNYGWDLNPVEEDPFTHETPSRGGVIMVAFGLSFLF